MAARLFKLVRNWSIVSLFSSSQLSSLLLFEYRFALFDAGLLGVDGMLRIGSKMAHRSSMTADLDTTSSSSVDVPHAVVLVFVHVVLDRSRDVDVRWSYDLLGEETSCDDESCGQSRGGHAVGHTVGHVIGHALLPSTGLEMSHHARLISGNRRRCRSGWRRIFGWTEQSLRRWDSSCCGVAWCCPCWR